MEVHSGGHVPCAGWYLSFALHIDRLYAVLPAERAEGRSNPRHSVSCGWHRLRRTDVSRVRKSVRSDRTCARHVHRHALVDGLRLSGVCGNPRKRARCVVGDGLVADCRARGVDRADHGTVTRLYRRVLSAAKPDHWIRACAATGQYPVWWVSAVDQFVAGRVDRQPVGGGCLFDCVALALPCLAVTFFWGFKQDRASRRPVLMNAPASAG